MEQWTATAADCLQIEDKGNIATVQGLLTRFQDLSYFGPWPLSQDADVSFTWKHFLHLAVLFRT
jgi:hypothetical protein